PYLPVVLEKMLKHAVRLPLPNPRTFVSRVMKSAGYSVHYENFGTDCDAFVVGNLVSDLAQAIEEHLQATAFPETGSVANDDTAKQSKPQWVKEQGIRWVGELRVGNCVVRQVRPPAVSPQLKSRRLR